MKYPETLCSERSPSFRRCWALPLCSRLLLKGWHCIFPGERALLSPWHCHRKPFPFPTRRRRGPYAVWPLEDGSPQRPHWVQGSPSYWDVTSIRVYPRLGKWCADDKLWALSRPSPREGPSTCQLHPEARRACPDRVLSGGGPPRTCGLAGAISGGIGQVSVPPPRPFGGATVV